MNELDKVHLQQRLSQLHEQRLKELSLEDDLGMETGYVTDSSINSRKGEDPAAEIEPLPADQTPINKSRKTKSERDKRRSSRVSLLDSKNDSGSENSSESATEEKQQPRYRKRAGSKRVEGGNEVKECPDGRRKRDGSKNVNRLSITVPPPEAEAENLPLSDFQPTTLQMNKKDIYSGTWNPKERAVLDQVLNNMDEKSDHKKSFMGMFKRVRSTKLNNTKEKSISKIVEDTEDELPSDLGRDKYPLNQYYSDSERDVKNKKIGLFRKIRESVKQKHEEALLDKQLAHYMPSPSQKKRGLFSKLGVSSKKKESGGRCRAHSSNDYARSVGVYIQPEEERGEKEIKPTPDTNSNLSKGKSGSFKNLFSSSRAKSVDNLNGAFEYYANPKQVFQRTPSISKLNSRAASIEKIDQIKRSSSHKSLDHAFEPVQYTAKEICYDDPMVYAQARFMQPQKANQRNTGHPHRQTSTDGYCSAYEDEMYRGYQSDVTPSMHMSHYAAPAPRFTFDHVPHPHPAYIEQNRPHSAMPGGYYPTPPPRHVANNFYATPQTYMSHAPTPMSPYFMPTQHAPPLPGYYTPGYATPGVVYPRSGFATPSGYTSESDYGYVQISPHFIQLPPVAPQHHSGYMAHQSRKAVQRSVSKNSSASGHSGNYGYASESSFCDDEIYSMVQPSSHSQQNTSHLQQNSSHSQQNTVPSSPHNHRHQLTTDV